MAITNSTTVRLSGQITAADIVNMADEIRKVGLAPTARVTVVHYIGAHQMEPSTDKIEVTGQANAHRWPSTASASHLQYPPGVRGAPGLKPHEAIYPNPTTDTQ